MDRGHAIAETHDGIVANEDADILDNLEIKLCPVDGTCGVLTYKL